MSVVEQRQAHSDFWHLNFGHVITVLTVVGALGLQWGNFDTSLRDQAAQVDAVKRAQQADEGEIAHIGGVTASLNTRVGAIEGQDVPTKLGSQDTKLAELAQQVQDLIDAENRARDERNSWQTGISTKLDMLIEKLAHLEGRQEKGK